MRNPVPSLLKVSALSNVWLCAAAKPSEVVEHEPPPPKRPARQQLRGQWRITSTVVGVGTALKASYTSATWTSTPKVQVFIVGIAPRT